MSFSFLSFPILSFHFPGFSFLSFSCLSFSLLSVPRFVLVCVPFFVFVCLCFSDVDWLFVFLRFSRCPLFALLSLFSSVVVLCVGFYF